MVEPPEPDELDEDVDDVDASPPDEQANAKRTGDAKIRERARIEELSRRAPSDASPSAPSPWARTLARVDRLTIFGFVAVTLMLVTYALEARSRWFVLAFAGACALGSAYGFLQGAWPFGVVEAVWALVALRRFWKARPKREGA